MKLRQPTTSPYLVVRTSSIHHKGAFAARRIPKGTAIIEYVGEKITKEESERRGDETYLRAEKDTSRGHVYIFDLDEQYDLDGDVPWNTARFINHSCEPNCEAVDDEGKIIITALRAINEGEELLYNYGYDVDEYEEHPCRCRSRRCVGYIVDEGQWPELRRRLKKTLQHA